MSALLAGVLGALGLWSHAAGKAPWLAALIGLAAVAAGLAGATVFARTWLEQRADRVAAGPIFALAGLAVFAGALLWGLADAALYAAGAPLLQHRLLLALGDEPVVRAALALPADGRVYLRGPVAVPLALAIAAAAYLGLVLWAGRTLAELTALEQKPDDVLAKERAEQRKAIEKALQEGRPMPAQEVVSLPLADDLFGRTFKLLGHWTSVERVEERFVRWQRPLVWAMTSLLALALAGAIGGHLPAALWAGAAIAIHGLGRNLRTPAKWGDPAPAEDKAAAAPPEPPSLRPLIEAVHRGAGPLANPPAPDVPQPAQISPGTDLQAKRILEDMRRELGLEAGLYVHQGLACDAFAARKNVLLTTPPLSGKRTLLDLFVLYALLVESETVLYIAPGPAEAHAAERRLRGRAEEAGWQWSTSIANLAGATLAGAVDLARAQPGVVFADPDAVHRALCGRQVDWQGYLGALGLVVIPDLHAHHGARGAHLANLLRRLRRAAQRAAPEAPPRPAAGERVRFAATADPCYRDLGPFAERLAGRPFLVLGPEVDGAPQPDRVTFVLPAHAAQSDLHPAVHALAEALAHGFSAELYGYEGVLAATDVARANERTLARGVATRGRSFADGTAGAAQGEALAGATVVVARASAARYAALPQLTSHLGFRAGAVPEARVAALGAGERVGAAAAPKAPEEEIAEGEAEAGEEGEGGAVTEEQIAATNLERKVLVLWQPDLEPLSALLVKERPHPTHPDLKLGCALVLDPLADRVQRAHLRCALAEAELPEADLARDFSRAVVDAELAALRAPPPPSGGAPSPLYDDRPRLVQTTRRSVDPASGALCDVTWLRLAAAPDLHASIALDASGEAVRVVDRHTGDILFGLERERALSAAYPGRIFVHAGRRFSVLPLEQQDALPAGRIACEREERSLGTSKIRRLTITPIDRRAGGDRRRAAADPPPPAPSGAPSALTAAPLGAPAPPRAVPPGAPAPLVPPTGGSPSPDDPRARGRRADPRRTIGGAPFTLRHVPVEVVEEVVGLRRHGPDGFERDAAFYPDPIASRYTTRAAILGLPRDPFGDVDTATLHALTHLFRATLPAFVHHGEEDLEVARGVVAAPAEGDPDPPGALIAFVDTHPGGAGFADAVDVDVLRQVIRWSLALVRRCSGGCKGPAGCLRCLQIASCHAEPEEQYMLDKRGADRVLAALVGPAAAKTFGPPPQAPG